MAKIIVFGGTCEGRLIAEAFAGTGLELHICVATEYGASLLPVCENVHIHAGRMDREEMEAFLDSVGADCCLDATHPYAAAVTENIREACLHTGLSYIRVLRREEKTEGAVVYRESIEDAVRYLASVEGNIFITTGSKELEAFTKLPGYRQRCFARVLPTLSVMEKCKGLGFEGKNLIGMQGPFSEELNLAMLKQVNASWLVTKNSGKEGGYPEKCEAALRAGAGIVVIGRPAESAKQTMELSEAVDYVKKAFGATAEEGGETVTMSEGNGAVLPQGGRISRQQVFLIGMGPGQVKLLTREAQECLEQCDVLIGAKRMLQIWPGYSSKPCYVCYRKEEIRDFLKAHPEYQKACILYSGDIGFYSGAKGMREFEEEFDLHPICGISSPLYFLNRLGVPWEKVRLISCHGQNGNLFSEIRYHQRVCTLLGEPDTVAKICRKLLEAGMERVRVTVGERLSYPEETILSGLPQDFSDREFDSLSVALFENPDPQKERAAFGIKDDAFVRGKAPMTKEEIRVLSLAKLGLQKDSVVYDVGAGTGSVSIEAALLCRCGQVYGIEGKEEAAALLLENQKKFAAESLKIVKGWAPDCLEDLEAPTHVFIGGSLGRLLEIIRAVRQKNEKARFVINAVTLETLSGLERIREEFPAYGDMEVVQVSVAKSRPLGGYHLMTAQNPVFIISFGGQA
ncbi:MAG: precorrin-6A reductase [Eubacteriales bacterium]|nr:precorrin-6A reductase [Eubacteriales bacterium]